MRKVIALILFASVILLAGCGEVKSALQNTGGAAKDKADQVEKKYSDRLNVDK